MITKVAFNNQMPVYMTHILEYFPPLPSLTVVLGMLAEFSIL